MDGLRVTLSSFAADEAFHETKAVTCLRTIKFSSVGVKDNTSNFVSFHFLSILEFKCKKKKKCYPELFGNSYKMLIKIDFFCT